MNTAFRDYLSGVVLKAYEIARRARVENNVEMLVTETGEIQLKTPGIHLAAGCNADHRTTASATREFGEGIL